MLSFTSELLFAPEPVVPDLLAGGPLLFPG